MEYTYTTTEAMDAALEYEAAKQNKTAEELFSIIVTADMGTLVRGYEASAKEELKTIYDKVAGKDRTDIDAILDKYKPKKPEPEPVVEPEPVPEPI